MNPAAYRGYKAPTIKQSKECISCPVSKRKASHANRNCPNWLPRASTFHSFQRYPHWEGCPLELSIPARMLQGTVPKYFPTVNTADPWRWQRHSTHSTQRESSSQRLTCRAGVTQMTSAESNPQTWTHWIRRYGLPRKTLVF